MGIMADPSDLIAGEVLPDPWDAPPAMIGQGYFMRGLKLEELTVNRYPPDGSSKAAAG